MSGAETRKQADRLSTQHVELCQGHEVYILDNVKALLKELSANRELCRSKVFKEAQDRLRKSLGRK
jgi:hypothetical protein